MDAVYQRAITLGAKSIAPEDKPHNQRQVGLLVKTPNVLGRIYLAFVKPFHRIIMRSMLAQVTGESPL